MPHLSLLSRPAPQPPRYDLLPQAVRSAETLRGSLLRCGPGYRGAGWPETPRVRLAALSTWLSPGDVAVRRTAAWVWGAARSPGTPLQAHSPIAARKSAANEMSHRQSVQYHLLRLEAIDTIGLGPFSVTTPHRTLVDLLHDGDEFTRVDEVTCRLLARMLPAGLAPIAEQLRVTRQPYRRLALARLNRLM